MASSKALEAKEDKLKGFAVATVIHLLLFLAFWWLRILPADPPWESLGNGAGVEVNFGFDEAGWGTVSTMETAGENEGSKLQNQPLPEGPTENEPNPKVSNTTPVDDNPLTTTEESPVELPEKKEPVKDKKPEKVEPVKEVKPTPEYKPAGGSNAAQTKSGGGANDGNVKGAVGNQGDPNGNPASLNYGAGGGGGGTRLEMTGWKWDAAPKVKDESDESGKIVFEIKVDDNGDIISIRVVEKTVSPSVVQIYRQEVEKLTFSKTRDNNNAARESVGRITFVIKND